MKRLLGSLLVLCVVGIEAEARAFEGLPQFTLTGSGFADVTASAERSQVPAARAAANGEPARARAHGAKLAALFDAAPRLTSVAALDDAWVMAEPDRGGLLRIGGGAAKVGYPAYNGLAIGASGAVVIAGGEARFQFAPAASSVSGNDMDGRDIPIQTTAAEYRCRVLADKDLMVCRVSYLPSHQDGASIVREDRYEGFVRDSYSPFR